MKPARIRYHPQDKTYVFNQQPSYVVVGDQEVQGRVALLTITPGGPLEKSEFSISTTLGFMGLEVREGNGKPLQYSCLENPMDGGAW